MYFSIQNEQKGETKCLLCISTTFKRFKTCEMCFPDPHILAETRAEIVGGTEVHVEQGSTLNLTCVVRNSRERPHYLLWYHNNQVRHTYCFKPI